MRRISLAVVLLLDPWLRVTEGAALNVGNSCERASAITATACS